VARSCQICASAEKLSRFSAFFMRGFPSFLGTSLDFFESSLRVNLGFSLDLNKTPLGRA